MVFVLESEFPGEGSTVWVRCLDLGKHLGTTRPGCPLRRICVLDGGPELTERPTSLGLPMGGQEMPPI